MDIKAGEITSTNKIHQMVPGVRGDHPNINLKFHHWHRCHASSGDV
jgi:hypothetical protein